MYIYVLLIVPLAIIANDIDTTRNGGNNVEIEFKAALNSLVDKIQTIINSESKTQFVDDLISDEGKNELLQKVGKWFENGDITPTQLINLATMSFAGKFDTSPQFNKCMGKYVICTIKHCTIHAKNYDSYDPEMLQCLGKCIPNFISCVAWAGQGPLSSEL